ncbi:MAG TPA: alpha-amylase family glycosyl hydrolase [Solirubrobacteraceae bacterium]|nr:alpha-amylase family glycosyl hydrolase [Solirubrobacteraceae bacterium]
MRLPARPTVYEINTAVWLQRLGRVQGRPLQLSEVPGGEWDALADLPVDAVWLMGVWQRSPVGLAIALADPQLDAANRAALPDLREEDVIGSPYCVRNYVVDERFGGPEALAAAREQLAQRGLALILDYVPNHVAPDHPWVTARPECLLGGSDEELALHPEAFIRTDSGAVMANGRDPYFPPWPDVVQLNAFSPALRDAVVETLIAVGASCDGLRCDMAMLMTNEVFARTWGERGGPVPEADYWPTLIGSVKEAHPELLFMAEAYWDMEWTLQQQGFDLCYDKRLYDRLAHDSAESVRGHLQADAGYQERLVRFIENHDEPRAAATFGSEQARAAAVVMSTLQGARLYHDGQLEGRRTRIPVFLGRGPDERVDAGLRAFYERLLRAVADSDLRAGDWRLCDCSGWPDNDSHRQLGAWCWSTTRARHLVVVNLAPAPAQARVHPPWEDLARQTWQLTDLLSGQRFERDGDELVNSGLYVALDPWGSHFLSFVGGTGRSAPAGPRRTIR